MTQCCVLFLLYINKLHSIDPLHPPAYIILYVVMINHWVRYCRIFTQQPRTTPHSSFSFIQFCSTSSEREVQEMGVGRDIDDLPKNNANHTALTPLWFLERAALVHPTRTSVVHGSRHYTWHQTYQRCRRFASALSKHSIGLGHTVRNWFSYTLKINCLCVFMNHFNMHVIVGVLICLFIILGYHSINWMHKI